MIRMMYFHNSTYDVFLYQYIWCIFPSEHVMYFYFSTYDVFLFRYIWCISISDWEWRALSGRALDLDWSFRLFPPALLSHNHFLDRRYRYIGFYWIYSKYFPASIACTQSLLWHKIYIYWQKIKICWFVWNIFKLFREYFSFGIPFTQSLLCWQQDFIGSCQILL